MKFLQAVQRHGLRMAYVLLHHFSLGPFTPVLKPVTKNHFQNLFQKLVSKPVFFKSTKGERIYQDYFGDYVLRGLF